MNSRTKEVSMVGRNMMNGSMPRVALGLLLAGGLVLGGDLPARAATPLGSQVGTAGTTTAALPTGAQPGAGSGSGSTIVTTGSGVIALGRKPGVSPGSGLGNLRDTEDPSAAVPGGTRRGAGIASGSNHIGEEIPQHIGEEIPQ
jgi:hypothetical protein